MRLIIVIVIQDILRMINKNVRNVLINVADVNWIHIIAQNVILIKIEIYNYHVVVLMDFLKMVIKSAKYVAINVQNVFNLKIIVHNVH